MNNSQKFELLSSIYDEISFSDDFRQGTLLIKNQETLDKLKICLLDVLTYGLSTLQNIENITIGQEIRLERGEPAFKIGLFHLNFDEFLTSSNLVQYPRKGIYFLEKKLSSLNPLFELDKDVISYKAMIDFINHVLVPSALYFDKDFQTLIYFDSSHKKIEVPIIYNLNDLHQIDIDEVNKLRNQFFGDIHQDQKYSIMAESVKGICGPISKKFRFSHLLKCINELSKSFNDGYKLFVAKFSYENIKDEIETAKIEEMAKLHKIISDVQNHILGIPIATIIVATQMKVASGSESQILINSFVLVGALIFTLLVTFVISNQKDTLSSLNNEITRKRDLIKREYSKIENIVNPNFEDLFKRVGFQKCVLNTVIFIVWAGFLGALIAYILLSFKTLN